MIFPKIRNIEDLMKKSNLILFIFRPESHPNLWENHSLHHPFLTWDNALIMKIITLLFTYNKITKYDSI